MSKKIEIKMPIYTAEELNALDKAIMTDFDNLVDAAMKHIYKDRECIILQKIIKEQQKEIEELRQMLDTINKELLKE